MTCAAKVNTMVLAAQQCSQQASTKADQASPVVHGAFRSSGDRMCGEAVPDERFEFNEARSISAVCWKF